MDISQKIVIMSASKILIRFSVFITIIIFYPCSYASDWKITPNFLLSESYSDNINLAPPSRKKGAFVTEFSPGISISRDAVKNIFNLDYRMQNLLNSGGKDKLEIFHQLQAESNLEIFRNSLFLDLNGSIGQQNATNLNIANDNLSGGENRTNVSTYGISPYWKPRLNGYADGELRFNYNKVMTDNSLASDSESFDYSVRLNSGRRFSRITWFVDYDKRNEIRENGDDVKFRKALIELRGHINRHYSFFTQIGHSKNRFLATTNQTDNGFFYAIGAKWKPSERFSLEGAVGNNSFVILDVMPTRRMHWVTTLRNNDIGTNTGLVWESNFDYKTQRSIWKASYLEDVITIQDELSISNNKSFTVRDHCGNLVSDPFTQRPVQFDISLPTLVDEVALIKKGKVSVSYKTGKSNIFACLFSNKTTFQASQTINDVVGVSGAWDWRFTRRSTFFIRPVFQQITRDDSKSNRYDISLGFTRRLPFSIGKRGKFNAKIEYQYVNQTSDLKTNEFTENRITANLFFTY